MDGLEGICSKCGAHYYGWGLRNPRHQMCGRCGVGLDIMRNGEKITTGYSPFDAPQYDIGPPPVEEKGNNGQDSSGSPDEKQTGN